MISPDLVYLSPSKFLTNLTPTKFSLIYAGVMAPTWKTLAIFFGVLAAVLTVLDLLLRGLLRGLSMWNERSIKKHIDAQLYDSETISRASRYYVPPSCTSIDPAQEAEPRNLIATEEDLLSLIDRFLNGMGDYRHLVILADSGMGKTSCLLNYFARNYQRFFGRKNIVIIPLGIPDADERISRIPHKNETTLFLDALDEDTKAIQDHKARISALMKLVTDFQRVILTSRTQFFPSDEEIPVETGILKIGARGLGKPQFEFTKIYISPLSDAMVKKFLTKKYPFPLSPDRRKAHRLIKKVPMLTARPMILTYLPDLIDSDKVFASSYEIYQEVVRKWIERESAWVQEKSLEQFSDHVAVDIFTNRIKRKAERISRKELSDLGKRCRINIGASQMRGRSLLNRDAVGNYKFAHRSIMEFLVARIILRAIMGDGEDESLVAELIQYFVTSVTERERGPRAIVLGELLIDQFSLTDQVIEFLSSVVKPHDLIELSEVLTSRFIETIKGQVASQAVILSRLVMLPPGVPEEIAQIIRTPVFSKRLFLSGPSSYHLPQGDEKFGRETFGLLLYEHNTETLWLSCGEADTFASSRIDSQFLSSRLTTRVVSAASIAARRPPVGEWSNLVVPSALLSQDIDWHKPTTEDLISVDSKIRSKIFGFGRRGAKVRWDTWKSDNPPALESAAIIGGFIRNSPSLSNVTQVANISLARFRNLCSELDLDPNTSFSYSTAGIAKGLSAEEEFRYRIKDRRVGP
jgi:hypothetical protein